MQGWIRLLRMGAVSLISVGGIVVLLVWLAVASVRRSNRDQPKSVRFCGQRGGCCCRSGFGASG